MKVKFIQLVSCLKIEAKGQPTIKQATPLALVKLTQLANLS